jgi:hypothetical protein
MKNDMNYYRQNGLDCGMGWLILGAAAVLFFSALILIWLGATHEG